MYQKLLVPLDGSKTAENVLPFARRFGRALRVPVELLELVDISAISLRAAADRLAISIFYCRRGRSSRNYLNEIAATFPGIEVQCTVARGRPAK